MLSSGGWQAEQLALADCTQEQKAELQRLRDGLQSGLHESAMAAERHRTEAHGTGGSCFKKHIHLVRGHQVDIRVENLQRLVIPLEEQMHARNPSFESRAVFLERLLEQDVGAFRARQGVLNCMITKARSHMLQWPHLCSSAT